MRYTKLGGFLVRLLSVFGGAVQLLVVPENYEFDLSIFQDRPFGIPWFHEYSGGFAFDKANLENSNRTDEPSLGVDYAASVVSKDVRLTIPVEGTGLINS